MNNQNTLLKNIIDKKLECVIVSPHFDDAVLSCGGLMLKLHKKANITVVNVFTKAHGGPYTMSAKKFIKDSGFKNAEGLFAARLVEDKKALSGLKVKVVNLGLVDALFRKKKTGFLGAVIPEFAHVYPTYRWHVVKNIAKVDSVEANLRNKLGKLINKKAVVIAPFGIGNHADHKTVRKVCEDLFANLILYSDFPYNVRTNNFGEVKDCTRIKYPINLTKKVKIIKLYKTQFSGLFQNSEVPKHNEFYFVKK